MEHMCIYQEVWTKFSQNSSVTFKVVWRVVKVQTEREFMVLSIGRESAFGLESLVKITKYKTLGHTVPILMWKFVVRQTGLDRINILNRIDTKVEENLEELNLEDDLIRIQFCCVILLGIGPTG